MIWYSFREIFAAVASALIYGGVFGIFVFFVKSITYLSKAVYSAFLAVFFYTGSLFSVDCVFEYDEKNKSEIFSEIFSSLSVILYTLGLSVVSYYTLYGECRIFLVIFSLFSFILFNRFLTPMAHRLLFFILRRIFIIPVILLRLLFYIPGRLFAKFCTKSGKNVRIMSFFNRFSEDISIDIAEK